MANQARFIYQLYFLLYFLCVADSQDSVGLAKSANVTVVNIPVSVEVFKVDKHRYSPIVLSDEPLIAQTNVAFRKGAHIEHLARGEDSAATISGRMNVRHSPMPQLSYGIRPKLHLVFLQHADSRRLPVVGVVDSPLGFLTRLQVGARFSKFFLHILGWISRPDIRALLDCELALGSDLSLVKLALGRGLGFRELVLGLSQRSLREVRSEAHTSELQS